MEKNNTNIILLIKEIIVLLEKNDEFYWSSILKDLLYKYCKPSLRNDAITDILRIYKGGMGSFNDVVLQKKYKKSMNEKEYKLLIEENERFDKLTSDLFNACSIKRSGSNNE